MRIAILSALIMVMFIACTENQEPEPVSKQNVPITGTWKLLSGTLIEKGDTVVTEYNSTSSFIKIINDSHFAFLHHDLTKGKDTPAVFSAGGGTYSIDNERYTEHLEYCTARNWEGHDFTFTVSISNDTLIQSGIEKIEAEGVDRMNIEKYVRVKQ